MTSAVAIGFREVGAGREPASVELRPAEHAEGVRAMLRESRQHARWEPCMPHTTGMPLLVFTKPWRMPLPRLCAHVRSLGFDGVELPVRPGYQVEPERARELRAAVEMFREHGLDVASVASILEESVIAACAEAGVPILRLCVAIHANETYPEGERRLRQELESAMPLLERYGVAVGIQNHCGRSVANACGLRALIGEYNPAYVCAVWDAAHNALQGEEPELALDIVWSHLHMVNLKNAFWLRTNGPEALTAEWRPYWTSGAHGLASWPRVLTSLIHRGYRGPICLTAEYDDHEAVDRLIAEDISYVRRLLGELRAHEQGSL